MKAIDLFAELASVTTLLETKKGMDFFSADKLCNETLLEVTGGTYDVKKYKVRKVVREVKSRLGLLEEGGAR